MTGNIVDDEFCHLTVGNRGVAFHRSWREGVDQEILGLGIRDIFGCDHVIVVTAEEAAKIRDQLAVPTDGPGAENAVLVRYRDTDMSAEWFAPGGGADRPKEPVE